MKPCDTCCGESPISQSTPCVLLLKHGSGQLCSAGVVYDLQPEQVAQHMNFQLTKKYE